MIEYASMEVSKLLVQAGFDKQPGADVDGFYTDEGDGLLPHGNDPLPRLDQDGVVILDHYPAYRADTLLAWLLEHGLSIDHIEHHSVDGFIVRFMDASLAHVCPLEAIEDTLPDALGKIVAQVLGVKP